MSDGQSIDFSHIPPVLSSEEDCCGETMLNAEQHDSGSDCVAMDSPAEEEQFVDVVSEDSAIQEETIEGEMERKHDAATGWQPFISYQNI